MKVGINLINFGSGATPETLARWAMLAEALGYHLLMISDHVAITPDVQAQYPAPFYDPFITLAWLAGSTHKIELGTTVMILPYRHPLLTARMATNLDQLSHGRFILGIGVGWAQQEFEVLGVPFNHRGTITDDYLAAIKAFWSCDVATYNGPFVSFENIHTAPRPVRQPHPPIWVGGNSDAALRRAVRYGDGWHPLNVQISQLRDESLPRLKDIAKAEAKPLPALCPRIKLRLTEAPLDDDTRLAGEGTLDQVYKDFEVLESLGAIYVLLDTYSGNPDETKYHEHAWQMLALIAEEVLDLANQRLR